MKNKIAAVTAVTFVLISCWFVVSAQSIDTILVTDADTKETDMLTVSSTLNSLLDSISNRLTIQYGDTLHKMILSAAAGVLTTLLDNVLDRATVEYADSIKYPSLATAPAALLTTLDQVATKMTIEYADTLRADSLSFPVTLINDTTNPIISVAPQGTFGASTMIIIWSTDELTRFKLEYGTNSGVYTEEVISDQYHLQHQVQLTGITEDIYYIRITSTDQSGNQSVSAEYEMHRSAYVYIPMIQR